MSSLVSSTHTRVKGNYPMHSARAMHLPEESTLNSVTPGGRYSKRTGVEVTRKCQPHTGPTRVTLYTVPATKSKREGFVQRKLRHPLEGVGDALLTRVRGSLLHVPPLTGQRPGWLNRDFDPSSSAKRFRERSQLVRSLSPTFFLLPVFISYSPS